MEPCHCASGGPVLSAAGTALAAELAKHADGGPPREEEEDAEARAGEADAAGA